MAARIARCARASARTPAPPRRAAAATGPDQIARSACPAAGSRGSPSLSALLAEFEHGQERLLRHLDPADLLHPLLALLLLLEQLALARDVAAVALGDHVLAVRLDRLAGDDPRPDRRLDRHVVLLARDLLAQLLGQGLAGFVGLGSVHEHRERVDRL